MKENYIINKVYALGKFLYDAAKLSRSFILNKCEIFQLSNTKIVCSCDHTMLMFLYANIYQIYNFHVQFQFLFKQAIQ